MAGDCERVLALPCGMPSALSLFSRAERIFTFHSLEDLLTVLAETRLALREKLVALLTKGRPWAICDRGFSVRLGMLGLPEFSILIGCL